MRELLFYLVIAVFISLAVMATIAAIYATATGA